MEESSLIGKNILIVENDFTDEEVISIEETNLCTKVNSIEDVLLLDLREFDFFICHYSFQTNRIGELIKLIDSYPNFSRSFLVSKNEYNRLKTEPVNNIIELDKAQTLINNYLETYPDFFKKIEPDFFKKRLIHLKIIETENIDIKDVAIFSYCNKTIGLISKSEINNKSKCLNLMAILTFGQETNNIELKLNGSFKLVEYDIEDEDDVHCYEFTINENDETYQEIIEALEKQNKSLDGQLKAGGFE